MRAAGCYGVESVVYTGQRYAHSAKFQLDTKNMTSTIPLTSVSDVFDGVDRDTRTVCIEFAVGATPLPDFIHPQKARYIFGPEDGNLEQIIIDRADAVVYIPTKGCMNLAATVNVVLYDRMAKTTAREQGDELIRLSRDTNNNLRVKKR